VDPRLDSSVCPPVSGGSEPLGWVLSPEVRIALEAPVVMGIINVTPDSFSDGGEALHPDEAARRAERMVEQGAVVLDVGAESTRPGAEPVPEPEQVRRLEPAIRAVRRAVGRAAAITVDTTRAAVARAALDAGADAINDVSGGTDDPALPALAGRRGCGLVLMHRVRPPSADAYSDRYAQPGQPEAPLSGDVVAQVAAWMRRALERAQAAGVPADRVALDPGLGFGKTVDQNLALIRGTAALAALGRPIVSGISRKSFTAAAAGHPSAQLPPRQRLPASVALSVLHLAHGARIFRVHDVGEHVQALRASWSLLRSGGPGALRP
jgi:dihydropteroate synthase